MNELIQGANAPKNNPLPINQQGVRNNNQGNYNTASTSIEAQREKILNLLAIRPHNTNELRDKGVMHPAGRIRELRQMGYDITTIRNNAKDGYYSYKKIAFYVLKGGKK